MDEFMKFEDCKNLSSKICFVIVDKLGWKITKLPDELRNESFIWIAYPHTSNWDTFFGFLSLTLSQVNFYIVVKDFYSKLIFKPLNYIAHLLPIKRDKSAISVINDKIKATKSCIVMVPEGTRHKTTGWKAGFHIFAKKHNMRILPTYVCYERKLLKHCSPITVEKTAEQTIAKCKEIYEIEKPMGKYPELASPIKLFE
jgi:hypothetical protein